MPPTWEKVSYKACRSISPRSNVQVNAIACGVIDTAMNAQFSEEEREALREEIPAGRFADSEEVAALALTLASGHSYLTGQIIGLDGGYI